MKVKDDKYARHGLIGVIRHFWKEILIGIAIVAGSQTVGYALTSFMPTYLEETVKVSNVQAAVANIPVLVVMSLCLPLIGRLSDKIGRKKVFLIAAGLTIVLMVPAFAVMQIGEMWAVVIALFMVALPAGFYIACLAFDAAGAVPDGIALRCHGPDLQHRRLPVRRHHAAVQPSVNIGGHGSVQAHSGDARDRPIGGP